MELLSLHQPWFLILFMLVPIVLAETILACAIFGLIYKNEKSTRWQSWGRKSTITLGIFFILATIYLAVFYVPSITNWRGPIDYIAVFSYMLAVIPAVLLLLQALGIIGKQLDFTKKNIRDSILLILFVVFTHFAMVFGMADPRLAGYVPPQNSMHMDHQTMNHPTMKHDMNSK
jgi:uncharacterized membrane protein